MPLRHAAPSSSPSTLTPAVSVSMSRLLRLAVVTGLLAAGATLAHAQLYRNAAGLRLGSPIAASYKHYISEGAAVEVYGGFRSYSFYRWFSVSAAYQSAYSFGLDGALAPLSWYWGAGASAYFWSYDDGLFGPFVDRRDYSTTTLGINGYVGLEYAFEDLPIVATVDWVPTVFVGNGWTSGFVGGQGALAVRYIIGR